MSSRNPHSSTADARPFGLMKLLQASIPVAVTLLGSMVLVGCDTPANQSDQKVQTELQHAQNQLAIGDTTGARKTLESVASSEATPLTRAIVKSRLAQVEQNAATKTMQQIELDDQAVHRLIFEISELTHQIDESRAIAASYDNYDPKKAKDALTAQIAAAQGGPNNSVWFKQDNTTSPSLAAVTQSISELQGKIAKQAEDLKSLQDQRTQVLDEADKADKSSEISKGQQSVDDFKRGADLRKQAGDLTVQIEKNQADTIPMQNDLVVAQGQQTVLQELIQQYQDQSQALDAGWKAVQTAVASQADLQRQILSAPAAAVSPAPSTPMASTPMPPPPVAAGSVPAGPPGISILPPATTASINDKADALKKLLDKIKSERTTAQADLNSATQHYTEAAKAGQEYFASLDTLIKEPSNSQRAELDAWKSLQAAVHPAVFEMRDALARRQMGELSMSELDDVTRLAKVQDEVAKVLGAANLTPPPALNDPELDSEKKSASDAATAALNASQTEMEGKITMAAPDPLYKLSRMQDVLTLYSQVQLARLQGDASGAAEKLKTAASTRDEAMQSGVTFPSLPLELIPPPTPPGAAPAPAPTP